MLRMAPLQHPSSRPQVDYSWPIVMQLSADGCCDRIQLTDLDTDKRLWLYDATDFYPRGSLTHPLALDAWLVGRQSSVIKFGSGTWRTAMKISRNRIKQHFIDDCYGPGSCLVQCLKATGELITYDPLARRTVRCPSYPKSQVEPFASCF
ncbi:MAG: hypothetical protein CEO22_274, partial [Candidatus Berkelbacteria bacterium Gr01-1014_85]